MENFIKYIYIFLLLLIIGIMLYVVFGKINVKCENKYEKSGYRSFNNTRVNTRVNTIKGSCIIGWGTATIFTNSSGSNLILPNTAIIKNIKFYGLKDCKQRDNTQGFTIVLVCETEKGGEGTVNLNGKNYVTVEELQTEKGFDSGEMTFNVQKAFVNDKMRCPEAPLSVNWGVYNMNDPTPFMDKKLEIEITYTD